MTNQWNPDRPDMIRRIARKTSARRRQALRFILDRPALHAEFEKSLPEEWRNQDFREEFARDAATP